METKAPAVSSAHSFRARTRPRQDHYGNSLTDSLRQSMSTKRIIDFKTSTTLLRNLFPNSHYSFTKLDTIATASFTVETLSNMAWLGGGGYDLLCFYIHGVCVMDSDGKMRKGIYCPLMLENLTDPIITGREELGVPKLYSDIDMEESGADCSVKIGWRGSTFAEFSWSNLTGNEKENTLTPEVQDSEGLLLHKYMPSHEIGKSICENNILLLNKAEKTSSIRSQRVSLLTETTFKIEDLGVKSLPTLHHIVSRLAEFPVFEILGGFVTESQEVSRIFRRLKC